MNKNEVAAQLVYLLNKYHGDESEKRSLIAIINDPSRPGLPVRGCLEDMRPYIKQGLSDADKLVIDNLLCCFG